MLAPAPNLAFFSSLTSRGSLPRHTRLGPVSGRWGQLNLRGARHWVHKRFHAEVAATDHEAGLRPRAGELQLV